MTYGAVRVTSWGSPLRSLPLPKVQTLGPLLRRRLPTVEVGVESVTRIPIAEAAEEVASTYGVEGGQHE